MSGKYALVIGNSEYQDARLAQLTAPGKDAGDLAHVLRERDLCAFDDVYVLLNEPEPVVREAIDEFFDAKSPDDLLLLYFSGHGVRDEQGALYLAVKNTNRSRLRSTAIKSDFIHEAMEQSRARRQVLILDCCNSGAFQQGTKAATGGSIGLASAFSGTGRVILTASDSLQYAWQGDAVMGNTQNSLFTHYLVEGLKGEAENDGDGVITVDELYDYAYEQVRLATPNQTPSKFSSKQEGEIVLRQIMRLDQIKAAPLPEALVESMDNPLSEVRLGALQELARLLKGKNLALARSAREALEKLAAEDDSLRVRKAANDALAPIREAEEQAKKEAEERVAAERAEAERLAAQKAEEERLAAEKVEAERIAAEKAEAERLAAVKAEEERLAAEKAEAERLAAQKAEEERIAAQKAEQQRLAAAKRKAQRLAARQAKEQRLAAQQAEAERLAVEKADPLDELAKQTQLTARKQAEEERAARQKAEQEEAARLRWEQVEAEKERVKREAQEKQETIRKRFDDLETQISGWKAQSQPELKLSPLPDAAPAVANTGTAGALPRSIPRPLNLTTLFLGGVALVVLGLLVVGVLNRGAPATPTAPPAATEAPQETATAAPAPTEVPQATATLPAPPTEVPVATAAPAFDSTAQATDLYLKDAFVRAGDAAFGPTSGSLSHHPSDHLIASDTSGVLLKNFVAMALFVNPYPTSTGGWDYGFTFREESANRQFRLVVDSDGRWQLGDMEESGFQWLQSGDVSGLDLSENGSNRIILVGEDNQGKLFVNGVFIADLDLSTRAVEGDIRAGTGFIDGHQLDGYATAYRSFTVWKLP